MITRKLIYIFLLLSCSTCFAQEEIDSVITIRRSAFFTDILKRKGGISCLQGVQTDFYIKYKSPFLKALPVEYLATRQGLVLHFGRSGKLYKMQDKGDSLLYFVRMDRTVNYNYNIGSYIFHSDGGIFELGGYGFWKSNGLLRQFNYVDKEWDITPTNREVHLPLIASSRYGAWSDTGGRYVYVPYQIIINDGLLTSDNGLKISPVTYRLDVKKRTWEELGEVTESALSLFKSANWTCYPSERGLLLGFTKGVYYMDFVSNRISYFNDPSLVQSLLRLQNSTHSYFYGGWVYNFNPISYKYDSLQIDLKKFALTGEVIWAKPFPYRVAVGSGLVVLIIGAVLFWGYGKRKQGTAKSGAPLVEQLRPFTETEQSLLQLLLSRSDKGLTANIIDINYVLGVKDKSPGMQKKVRSDVLNNLNEKYAFVTRQKEPLVQSIRSESDKRYFEYLINPVCRDTLRQLLA
jgi:hypothetical protein